MTTLQTNLPEAAKNLPPQQLQKVIQYIESLTGNSHTKPTAELNNEDIHPEVQKRTGILSKDSDIVFKAKGMLKNPNLSVDAFLARNREDKN